MALDYNDPAPLNYAPNALQASVIVPGRICVYHIGIHSTKSSAQYVNMFDANTVPADTAVPLRSISVGANGTVDIDYTNGRQFQTGLVMCTSSTDATKTIGSADTFFDVQFDVYDEQNAPGTGA